MEFGLPMATWQIHGRDELWTSEFLIWSMVFLQKELFLLLVYEMGALLWDISRWQNATIGPSCIFPAGGAFFISNLNFLERVLWNNTFSREGKVHIFVDILKPITTGTGAIFWQPESPHVEQVAVFSYFTPYLCDWSMDRWGYHQMFQVVCGGALYNAHTWKNQNRTKTGLESHHSSRGENVWRVLGLEASFPAHILPNTWQKKLHWTTKTPSGSTLI